MYCYSLILLGTVLVYTSKYLYVFTIAVGPVSSVTRPARGVAESRPTERAIRQPGFLVWGLNRWIDSKLFPATLKRSHRFGSPSNLPKGCGLLLLLKRPVRRHHHSVVSKPSMFAHQVGWAGLAKSSRRLPRDHSFCPWRVLVLPPFRLPLQWWWLVFYQSHPLTVSA